MKKSAAAFILILCASCLSAGSSGFSRDISLALSYDVSRVSESYNGEYYTGSGTQMSMKLRYNEYFSEEGGFGAFVEISPLYKILSSESNGVSEAFDSDIHNFTDTLVLDCGAAGRFAAGRNFSLTLNAGMHFEYASESGTTMTVLGVSGEFGALTKLAGNFAFRAGAAFCLPLFCRVESSGVSVKNRISGFLYGLSAGCALLL